MKTLRKKVVHGFWIIIVLNPMISCDFYKDDYTPKIEGSFEINMDGLVSSVFTERNDSIFLSLNNISGEKLENLVFLVQLYDRTVKTKESLRFTKKSKIDVLEAGQNREVGFLAKAGRTFSNQSVRFEILLLNSVDLYEDISGVLKGVYEITNSITGTKVTYFIDGFINYKGDFVFEASGPEEYFRFITGRFDSNNTLVAQLLKVDNSIISSPSGAYSTSNNKIKVTGIALDNSNTIELTLNRRD